MLNLLFEDRRDTLSVYVYRYFTKAFYRSEIEEAFGSYKVVDGRFLVERLSEERTAKKFLQFFRKYKRDLKYKLNGNKAIFVDEDLGLPLIGLNFLGIVDKGSDMIELKPITNCNANCIFCSVNEGKDSNKEIDFVVDKDFLVRETKALLAYKKTKGMSIWINPHGEPTLYSELVSLCDDLLRDEYVKDIHIVTNGILLNKNLSDALYNISKKNIHVSVSMSGADIMGESYPVETVFKNLEYTKLPVTITPVYVKGINDDEIKKLVSYSSKIGVKIAVQKFTSNKRGRNPIEEQSWKDFFDFLKKLEKKNGLKHLNRETRQPPLVCKRKDKIDVRVVCQGRYEKDRLGVLETPEGNRAVVLVNCKADKGIVKAAVLQNKHNMILAKC